MPASAESPYMHMQGKESVLVLPPSATQCHLQFPHMGEAGSLFAKHMLSKEQESPSQQYSGGHAEKMMALSSSAEMRDIIREGSKLLKLVTMFGSAQCPASGRRPPPVLRVEIKQTNLSNYRGKASLSKIINVHYQLAPCGQSIHFVLVGPANWPSLQAKHACDPYMSVILPVGHALHWAALPSLNIPGRHFSQLLLNTSTPPLKKPPSALYVPTGQPLQRDSRV